jgi:DNA-binding IclR family transcriptional regulator
MLTTDVTRSDWLEIIRAEYLEIPGLNLTKPQIRRLWGLDARTCDALLDSLVEDGFLKQASGQKYVRADLGV